MRIKVMRPRHFSVRRIIVASAFAGMMLVACNSGTQDAAPQIPVGGEQRAVTDQSQTGAPNGKVSDGTSAAGQTQQQQAGAGDQDGKSTASFYSVLYSQQLQPYVNLADKLTYKCSYLNHNSTGDITFNNGKAQVKVDGLPSGQSGTLSFDVLDNNVVKLHGELVNLTLKSGNNDLTLKMQAQNGGLDDTAQVSLQIVISDSASDSGNSGGNSGGSSGGSGNGGRVNFAADIQPLAQAYCSRCHYGVLGDPTTQAFWLKYKDELVKRLPDNSVYKPMPVPGSQEFEALKANARQTLVDYVNQL